MLHQIDKIKFVSAIQPQAGASISGTCISLKNVLKCLVVVQIAQASATQVVITLEQSTAVNKDGHTAITEVVPIWSNLDTAASDVLVKRTRAVNYTTDAGQKNKIVIFEIDASKLDATYDCINVLTGASNAGNLTSAHYICELRYSGADLDAN